MLLARGGIERVADALFISPGKAAPYILRRKRLDKVHLDTLKTLFTPTELATFKAIAWRT